jgi:hypothetical protein
MKRSNTHREPILLYCSQPTQTHDESETHYESEADSEDSEFPPCRVGNDPPLISRRSSSPVIRPNSHHPRAAASSSQRQLTISSGKELQRRRQLNKGLGKTNVVNTVDAKVLVLYISCIMM